MSKEPGALQDSVFRACVRQFSPCCFEAEDDKRAELPARARAPRRPDRHEQGCGKGCGRRRLRGDRRNNNGKEIDAKGALNLDLVWLGVIVVKYMEIGLLTPPVGFNVYVIKGVVGDKVELEEIFKGVTWFLVCEFFIMVLLIGFPQISLYLPNLML